MFQDVTDFISTATVAFAALFPIVNPVGDAPIFLGLTRQYPRDVQKLLARKIAGYGFLLLAGSTLFGSEVLSFFGVSLYVLQIAGGFVGATTGWLLLNAPSHDADRARSTDLHDALSSAFYPLTLPLTVCPGCISVAITLGAHIRAQAGPGFVHGYPRHLLALLLGSFFICLLVMWCYSNAERLMRLLGETGTNILTRLSAFILLAMGLQIMWNGLKGGLPNLM